MTTFRANLLSILFAFLALASAPQLAHAQETEPVQWRSLKYSEVNMRVGPSEEYPKDWVYRREGLPVQVIRTREAWHLVRDHEGTQGWIADSQMRRTRMVLVTGEGLATLRETPEASGAVRWRAEAGVIGRLLECEAGWCQIDVKGRTGWVDAERLWGDEELKPGD